MTKGIDHVMEQSKSMCESDWCLLVHQ